MSFLFRALGIMVEYPWLALVPGGLLLALYGRLKRAGAFWAGSGWLAYCLYEYGMKWRLLCSGECNIRIDLLLLYPLLVLGSIAALVGSLPALRGKPR